MVALPSLPTHEKLLVKISWETVLDTSVTCGGVKPSPCDIYFPGFYCLEAPRHRKDQINLFHDGNIMEEILWSPKIRTETKVLCSKLPYCLLDRNNVALHIKCHNTVITQRALQEPSLNKHSSPMLENFEVTFIQQPYRELKLCLEAKGDRVELPCFCCCQLNRNKNVTIQSLHKRALRQEMNPENLPPSDCKKIIKTT